MSILYEKSQQKLELQGVLELLAACACSDDGKNVCLGLTPISDLEDVQHLLEQTTAAYDLCTKKGNPAFAGIANISESLERANKNGCLHPKELLQIGAVLRCTRTAKAYVSEDDPATILDILFEILTPNKYLEDKILGAILSEEEIADNASTTLYDIRRHMRV